MVSVDPSVLDNIATFQRQGEPDVVVKIITVYLSDVEKTLEGLESAVGERNAEEMHRMAHKLKSSSANVGAHQLSSLFRDLEGYGRRNEVEGCPDLFGRIKTEFAAVKETLEARVRSVAGASTQDK